MQNPLRSKVCLYCKNCNKLACPNCVSETHNKHELDSLSNIFQTRYNKLKYIRGELEVDLSFFIQEFTEIEKQQSIEKDQLEKTKGRILSQAEKIKREVNEECARTIEKLEINYCELSSDIEANKNVNIDIQHDIKKAISILDTTLHGNDLEAIINAENNALATMTHKEKYVKRENKGAMKFKSGNVDKSQLSSMVGSLKEGEEKEIQFEVANSYESNFGIVTNLHACLDGHIIMIDEAIALSMQKMGMINGKIKVIKEIKNLRVFDITETESSELIVSFMDSTCLKRLKADGTFEHFLELSPLLPRALHYTKSGKLLLSVREQGDFFPITPKSQRKLLVMERNGNQIHEYYRDDKGKPLFSFVARIRTGINNVICVIDWISDNNEGYVAALSYPDRFIWRYTGHSSINTDTKKFFRPIDIATTATGNIVVSDVDTNVLHILNTRGTLKCYIETNGHGIYHPNSFAINASNEMWIGCSKRQRVKTANAMLCIVKFSGF